MNFQDIITTLLTASILANIGSVIVTNKRIDKLENKINNLKMDVRKLR